LDFWSEKKPSGNPVVDYCGSASNRVKSFHNGFHYKFNGLSRSQILQVVKNLKFSEKVHASSGGQNLDNILKASLFFLILKV
jgi:hypothetical protein